MSFQSCFHHCFIRHPQEVGESYLEHAWEATKIGTTLIWYGTMELAHAIVPGFDYFHTFEKRTSVEALKNITNYIDKRYE